MAGVKFTGAEYTEFTAAEWGPDWYWDETLFTHNGVEVDDIGEVQPGDEIVLLAGTIIKGYEVNAEAIDARRFARKWLKARSVTTVIVEVPNAEVEELHGLAAARHWKVIR